MAISIARLSIWEIAHRWHNADTSHSKTIADIPLEVKDTLRNLTAEVYYENLYSTLPLEREAENGINKPFFTRNYPYFWKKTWYFVPVSHYTTEFKAVMKNEIDPVFLQSVMIPHWELEYWCKEYQVPFPEFWVRSVAFGGNKAPFPNATEFVQDEESDTNHNEAKDEKTKSENHRHAANVRHEPVNQLKRECVKFSLGKEGSNAEIVKKFLNSLPNERKKILSENNAVRTLSEALSEFKNGADKYWLQGII